MNTLVLEDTEHGEIAVDVYQKLSNDRILFLHEHIDDKVASDICAALLLKNAENKEKISLFINSESGDIRSVFMIYDVINLIDSPVETVCMGSAWDEPLLILAAGHKGMRYATENSSICTSALLYNRMHISDLTDAKIIQDIIKNDNKKFLEAFSLITKKKYSVIAKDFNQKKFMTPTQAKKYGLIDGIIKNKK